MGFSLGPFELDRRIGRGGMGDVWTGVWRHSRSPIAIKIVPNDWARAPSFQRSFARRLTAAAGLAHPNILRIHDYGIVDATWTRRTQGRIESGCPWIAMDLAARDLPAIRTWDDALRVLGSVIEALAHAHAHDVVHRDLTPRNLMVMSDGRVVVSDFGQAWRMERTERSAGSLTGVGGCEFLSPEQISGSRSELGPHTDLYALACITWTLTTGASPFVGRGVLETLQAHLGQLPPAYVPLFEVPDHLEDWLRHLLQKDWRDRPATVAEARARLMDSAPALPQFRAEAPHPGPTPAPGPRRWGDVGVVGRIGPRKELWQALRKTEAGDSQAVILSGAAGTGRTHLIRWLARRAHAASGVATVHAQGRGGIPNALARHLGCDGEPAEIVRQRLQDLGLTDASGLTALLDGALGPPLLAWLEHASASRPVILAVDDIEDHPETLRFLRHLREHLHGIRVLLIVTVASDRLLDLRDGLAGLRATHLPLEPLADEEIAALLDRCGCGGTLVAPPVTEAVAGSPLFAFHIGRALQERGLVVDQRVVDSPPTAARLPTDTDALWFARCEVLEADDVLAMEQLALLGDLAGAREWGRLGVHPARPPEIAARGLVRPLTGGRVWQLAHPSLGDFLRRVSKEQGRAKGHHEAIVSLLRGLSPDTPGVQDRIAYHRAQLRG